jgi:hypothetical protein
MPVPDKWFVEDRNLVVLELGTGLSYREVPSLLQSDLYSHRYPPLGMIRMIG